MGVRPPPHVRGVRVRCAGHGPLSPHSHPIRPRAPQATRDGPCLMVTYTHREFRGRRPQVLLGGRTVSQTPASVFPGLSAFPGPDCEVPAAPSLRRREGSGGSPSELPLSGGNPAWALLHTAALQPFQSRAVAAREAGSSSSPEQGGALSFPGAGTPCLELNRDAAMWCERRRVATCREGHRPAAPSTFPPASGLLPPSLAPLGSPPPRRHRSTKPGVLRPLYFPLCPLHGPFRSRVSPARPAPPSSTGTNPSPPGPPQPPGTPGTCLTQAFASLT